MKTDIILSDLIDESKQAIALSKAEGVGSNFNALCSALGLDVKSDFIHSNLFGVDFSGANLTGCNFYGADLRESFGIDVIIDDSTILDGADLDGSMFAKYARERKYFREERDAEKYYKILKSEDYSYVTSWVSKRFSDELDDTRVLKNIDDVGLQILLQKLITDEIDISKRASLFHFLRDFTETPQQLREIILQIIAFHINDSAIIRSFLKVAGNIFSNDSVIARCLLILACDKREDVREQVFHALTGSELFYERFEEFRALVFSPENTILRKRWLRSTAIELGDDHVRAIGLEPNDLDVDHSGAMDWNDLGDTDLTKAIAMKEIEIGVKNEFKTFPSPDFRTNLIKSRMTDRSYFEVIYKRQYDIMAQCPVLSYFFRADNKDEYESAVSRAHVKSVTMERKLEAAIANSFKRSRSAWRKR